MKNFLLSVDYELFFGSDSGTVENCMIRPVRRLMTELNRHGYKMTVFWDILHFYRLKQLEDKIGDLYYDRDMIEQQIRTLIRYGHDVQMQIYPHWLDACWENNKWQFHHNRFSLHRLWDEPDPDNIETVMGCITQARMLMESVIRKEDPDYKVRVFRAGGSRVHPFSKLADALKANGIRVDSSVVFGTKSSEPQFPFDYRTIPRDLYYRFNDSVLFKVPNGYFWEFPKESVLIPGLLRFVFYLQGIFSNTSLSRYGDGKPLWFTHRELWGHLWFNPGARYFRLSPENKTRFKWRYMMTMARDNSQIMLNSKNIGPDTIRLIRELMTKKTVRFYSFRQRLAELKVYDDLK